MPQPPSPWACEAAATEPALLLVQGPQLLHAVPSAQDGGALLGSISQGSPVPLALATCEASCFGTLRSVASLQPGDRSEGLLACQKGGRGHPTPWEVKLSCSDCNRGLKYK